ncbi:hypothetical protein [Pseudoramibacter faecis]|uniref:hypothetical protein n=1 Tax=Pseudoramibacter faecis TaxID=3108534 RepID=UPI002E77D827|nr:hypothetical protein [Pseudoramibacter sp. HA2172]
MASNNTYDQYFDVNEKYFPCIDDSAIEGGARWDDTYPHKEFIKLLKSAENMLSGSTNRSIWIHGAYGTGKSKCAYALKKILEVPDSELEAYWNTFPSLKKEYDLLTKLEGHRERGIVTVYRYATGGITTPEKFFFAIQESLHDALVSNDRISYMGENTLKENVIAWIKDPSHKRFLDDLLNKPEWQAKFPQSNSDEILNSLSKPNGDIKGLMSNIFDLAEKEGIRAMTLDADSLKNWIKDIIEKNHVKIVFFWDEFSKFFENNRYSLDEFQKIVSLCQEVPFYLVIVTHRASSIINDQDESWKIVQQRFNQVEITLPNNIAFELIGQAFKAKPAAASKWSRIADTLNARLTDSRAAVMKAANIDDPNVIKDIMPIHPMAALVLKNIAEAFASNQRSMFDFIKVRDDSQAFQWFISHYGPEDDHPLLTIDMLWDFFYEKGKDNLSPDIRMILDTFPQQKNLRDDEQRVLKTVLIMQAIDKRLSGSIEVLKPTDQNLSYAFEGITSGEALDTRCKGLAKGLCNKGVLVQNPIGNGKYAYGVAVLAGDQARIDDNKRRIRDSLTTANLVKEGSLETCLSLTPPLRLRFAEDITTGYITPVTVNDFTKVINTLKNCIENWHFNAVIAFSKDDTESAALRDKIKQAAFNEEYKNILFIDTTSSPLGVNDLDSYVDYAALAVYYQGSNPTSSKDNNRKAKQILSTNWKNRIYNGKFIIYNHNNPNGESVIGGAAVADVLTSIVLKRFPYIPDFGQGSSESQFKLISPRNAALCGINAPQKTTGTMQGAEKYALKDVWAVDRYWEEPETSSLPISIIKRAVDEYIDTLFKKSQPVSMMDIYNLLQADYGYAPSNLTVFLMGFLLKEYSSSQIRYEDQNGAPGEMSPEKLAELIANCVNKNIETYIVKMTPNERAFYETTSIAWDIDENLLTSPVKAGSLIKARMQKNLKLPVWCLEEVDTDGVFGVVSQYISFVQKEGADAHQIVNEIGRESTRNKGLAQSLKKLITVDNCRKGMLSFIGNRFENGKLKKLAHEIGASDDNVLDDISRLFSVEYSALWNKDTGEDQIRKVIVDYTYVKITNNVLQSSAHSKKDADKEWKEKLEFTACSCEALQEEYPSLKTALEFLRKLYDGDDILPEQMRVYVDDLSSNSDALKSYFDSEPSAFSKIYSAYLEGLNEEDIFKLISAPSLSGIFASSRTESNSKVKKAADEFRKNQTKTQLLKLWRDKTGTKTPMEWSSANRTPILLLVPKDEYDRADKAFSIINSGNGTEEEFQRAAEYIKNATFFSKLQSKQDIDNAFRGMLGIYGEILTDLDHVRDSLESLGLEPYKWSASHPSVSDTIKRLAKAEYEAGGSDLAIKRIDSMKDEDLREYLISLVKSDIAIGLGILNGGE